MELFALLYQSGVFELTSLDPRSDRSLWSPYDAYRVQYVCPHCGKPYTKRHRYRKHLEIKHGVEIKRY